MKIELLVPFKGIGPAQMLALHVSDSLVRMLETANCACCRRIVRVFYSRKLPRWLDASKLVKLGNYFSHRENGALISYMPGNREQSFTPAGTWAREGRQAIKPARLLKSLLVGRAAARVPDQVLASFATAVKVDEERNRVHVEILPASEIERVYEEASFGSCMVRDDGTVKPIGAFYQSFGGACRIAVLSNSEGKQRARALLWETNEGQTVLDRIYSYDPAAVSALLEHADSKGWVRKSRQALGAHLVDADGGSVGLLTVEGEDVSGFGFVPYVDTFKYHSGGTYYTDGCIDDNDILESTVGGYSPQSGDDDDTTYVSHGEWAGDRCPTEAVITLDNGDTYHCDDTRIVCCEDREWRLRRYCCEIDGDWYDKDDSDVCQLHNDEWALVEDCTMVCDDWYPDDEVCTCERSGESALIAECYEIELRGRTIYVHKDHVTPGDDC